MPRFMKEGNFKLQSNFWPTPIIKPRNSWPVLVFCVGSMQTPFYCFDLAMAMMVDQTIAEHELFGYSTTTTATTTKDEHGYNWNDCSPMVDWDARNQRGEDHDRHINLPSVTVRRICSRVSNVDPYFWRRAHRLELLTDKLQPSPVCERRAGNRDGRYKGVRMRKWGKWVAEVRQPNSRDRIWLGSYRRAEEAARAYDAIAFCLRGPSATLNFSDCLPDVPDAAELSQSQIQVAASRHAQRATKEEGESSGGGAVGTSEASFLMAAAEVFYVGEFTGGYFGGGELMTTRDEEGFVATDERRGEDIGVLWVAHLKQGLHGYDLTMSGVGREQEDKTGPA